VRAITDTGSQQSYTLKKTTLEREGQPTKSERVMHPSFRRGLFKRMEHHYHEIRAESLTGRYACGIFVLDHSIICETISRSKVAPRLEELKRSDITQTDVEAGQSTTEIVTGADAEGHLYTANIKRLECGLKQYKPAWDGL
jgi:hypothetical protein